MPQRKVVMDAGGVARWGRQLPHQGDIGIVGYEADIVTRLQVSGEEKAHYFRSVYSGMDEVAADGSVPHGYGTVFLEDIHSEDTLIGHVDWFIESGEDRGTFTFREGTGYWKAVSGTISARLEFSTLKRGDSLTSGDPVAVMGFLEGDGIFAFPD